MNPTMQDVRLVAYCRVSTKEQGKSGLGLDAQRLKIEREAEYRGWTIVEWFEDVASGKSTNGRGGLSRALEACSSGAADGLISAKLDRVSRSVVDFGQLIEKAQREGWALVILDPQIDLSTPTGRMVAGVLVQVAQWEREVIAERIKDALAEVRKRKPADLERLSKERGRKVKPIGNPSFVRAPAKLEKRIRKMRAEGLSLRAIATQLEREKIPTMHGGKWQAQTIKNIAERGDVEP